MKPAAFVKTGRENRQSPAPTARPRWGESRRARWRAGVLLALNLAMIAHFIQWRLQGRTISPIEPSESMQTLQHGAINAGFIFFALAILATMLFGRFVCGWGCHILALQDSCGWLMKKIGITPRPFRSRLLLFVPLLAAFYMFAWPTVYRLLLSAEPGPVLPPFTNHIVTSDFWSTFPPVAIAIPFLLICGFATVYFLGAKGFCTYACPYGGIFAVVEQVAPARIRVTDACMQCGHCTAVCTSNVVVHQEVRDYKMVVDPGCMKCMDCVSACPTNALYYGFGAPALGVRKTKTPSRFSLTWPEEIAAALVFAGCFFAFRGAYGAVPFLMALGTAAVATFLLLRGWHLLRKRDLSLHQTQLKIAGALRPAGWAFAAGALLVLLLTAHTGWIRYHEVQGDRAFQRLQVPDELALAQADPRAWVNPADRETIESGRSHLALTRRFGLLRNGDLLAKLAWFEHLGGDAPLAIETLAVAAANQRAQAKALSLYYRGSILNRLGRYEEAKTDLERALAERDDLILARQELGESLWQLGDQSGAIMTWEMALSHNPRLPLASSFLAGALDSLGRSAEATTHRDQAERNTPEIAGYHWMLGLRLERLGMRDLAGVHFQRAVTLDPSFRRLRP